jgi:tRNA-splicing ligase RtcB
MGTGSFIVRGLGNPESFESAPHGAGRKMSRGEARRRFTPEDLAAQTAGVECRKDSGVVDEIPGAYKPIEEVIEKSRDLVEVVARLKQVVCVKG